MLLLSYYSSVFTTLWLVLNTKLIFGKKCTCTADEFICENTKLDFIPKEIPCLNGTFTNEYSDDSKVSSIFEICVKGKD